MPLVLATGGDAVGLVLASARQPRKRGADVHLCNAFTLALADRDPAYRQMLQRASLNLVDGHPVAWAMRRAGPPSRGAQRIRGNDLFCAVLDQGRELGLRHYLLGGEPETVEALRLVLELRFPGVIVVGAESPPFRALSDAEKAERDQRITASGADVVWVGLGTPKQDWAVAEIAASTGTVAVAVGAAFDFLSGRKAEAPSWMQGAGLEWAHRLGTEPRRLWKRYLFGNSRFLYAVARYRSTAVPTLTEVIPAPRATERSRRPLGRGRATR